MSGFYSTRGDRNCVNGPQAVLRGIAPDGGLYTLKEFPQIPPQELVGASFQEISRRVLGAYLTGYTALCNYAHHLGSYNDDSTTYKPMVLAYGIYDGVLDTIAWEGFREGIDDIRYATLMTDLARKAAKSKDLKVRYLGSKAMQYLALTDARSCDQDSVRGEMIRFINELKPLVAPYDVKPETANNDVAAAKAGAARAEANLKKEVAEAIAKVAEAKNESLTNKAHVAVADVYAKYGRRKEGGAYLEQVGLFAQAANYFSCLPEKRTSAQGVSKGQVVLLAAADGPSRDDEGLRRRRLRQAEAERHERLEAHGRRTPQFARRQPRADLVRASEAVCRSLRQGVGGGAHVERAGAGHRGEECGVGRAAAP